VPLNTFNSNLTSGERYLLTKKILAMDPNLRGRYGVEINQNGGGLKPVEYKALGEMGPRFKDVRPTVKFRMFLATL
jgi:hypothetical protein